MFWVGNPGTGKTQSLKARLDPDLLHYINAARLTTFQLYKQLFKARNKAIILDDVDDALRRSDMARLLMALCETDDQARTVAWLGTESLLKVKKGNKVVRISQEFTTTSRVCIIQARGNATEQLVQRLLADPSFVTDKARIEAFAAHADGGSRRTWFTVKKKLSARIRARPTV